MSSNVNERACAIATFRWISVQLMETVARWTPISAEMEAKVFFGRHIWDYAQMADALGKRTFELRQPEHYTLPAAPAYAQLIHDIAALPTLAERVAALYQGMVPGLIARYRRYVEQTDPILDEPTVVIVERIVRDLERHCVEAAALQRELGLAADGAAYAAREAGIGDLRAERLAA